MMATNFPTSRDSFTNRTNGQTIDASHVDDLQDAVEAMQKRSLGLPLVIANLGAVARTSRSFAHKAAIFTPSANLTLYGVRCVMPMPAAAITVKGEVFTVSAGAIATITQSVEYTNTNGMASTAFLDLLFASPVALTSGTAYGLGAGYSTSAGSATSTSDFPVYISPRDLLNNSLPRAGTWGSSSYHIASFTPVVATAVTTSANDQGTPGGAAAYAILPIFDWA